LTLLRSESRLDPRLEAASALRGRLGTNLPLGAEADALLQSLVYNRLQLITKSEYVLEEIESAEKAAYWDLFAVQRRAGMGRRRTRIRVDMDALDRELSAAYRLAIRNDPCFYCGGKGEHDDHYHALADGGTDHWWNLVRACEHCNCSKGAKHGDDFLKLVNI